MGAVVPSTGAGLDEAGTDGEPNCEPLNGVLMSVLCTQGREHLRYCEHVARAERALREPTREAVDAKALDHQLAKTATNANQCVPLSPTGWLPWFAAMTDK